jgi:hypothetical protein
MPGSPSMAKVAPGAVSTASIAARSEARPINPGDSTSTTMILAQGRHPDR